MVVCSAIVLLGVQGAVMAYMDVCGSKMGVRVAQMDVRGALIDVCGSEMVVWR